MECIELSFWGISLSSHLYYSKLMLGIHFVLSSARVRSRDVLLKSSKRKTHHTRRRSEGEEEEWGGAGSFMLVFSTACVLRIHLYGIWYVVATHCSSTCRKIADEGQKLDFELQQPGLFLPKQSRHARRVSTRFIRCFAINELSSIINSCRWHQSLVSVLSPFRH